MPNWNSEQLKAIQTKHKNILVSASAGAGKTTVLIARLVDLVIQDRISIDHILAMTFTEAAANEMKKRLAAELTILYQKAQDPQEKEYIAEQLSAISTAHISTIHSFCLSIIQEFYYVIGLSAKRIKTIMDPATSSLASEAAMRRVLKDQYAKQEDAFFRLTLMFSTRAESDEQLCNAIKTLATNANAQSDPKKWFQSCRETYQTYERIEQLPEPILHEFFDDYLVKCEIYEQELRSLQRLYHTIYAEETKKAVLVDKKMAAIPALMEAIRQRDYTTFKEAWIAQCHVVVPPSPDKDDKGYASLRKSILAQEDAMLERLFDERTLLSDIDALQEPIEVLLTMCEAYRDAYAKWKEAHDCIDFDDMEHFALAILKANNGQVADHYRALFDEIMVDEFQDSNDVQNTLVQLICRTQNVFRVGDIKQSIYGFRHAKPQLMRGLITNRSINDEVIYLSNNYRSKKMIVDFNNALFKQLMNLEGFDGSYAKEDDVEIGVSAQRDDNAPIVFHALDATAIKEHGDIIASTNELKASYIADQIIAIKGHEGRKWKDFVVLVRANARKEDMKKVFDELSIPYFIDVKSGFYQSSAVQIVLSLLRALVDPHDEISFVACMTSPLFQIQMQDMAEYALLKLKNEDFYQVCLRMQNPQIEVFEQLRKQLYQIGICEMLTQIFEMHNFYQDHTSSQERTNLDLLFENATTFENEEGKGVLAFIKSIDAIQNAQSAEAIPIGSDEDVVRVMSIHQSKGLQFPVVFLWSNSRQTPVEFKELFICDSELGIGLKHMQLPERFTRSTIIRQAMEHKKDREELEEEMRILYVATTRAQQQMHIVDCIKSLDDYEHPMSTASIYQRGGYTSWVLTSTLADDRSLFQIKPVSAMWKTTPQVNETQAYCELPQYVDHEEKLEFTSPSLMKQENALPQFSSLANSAMNHGSLLHRIIEEQAQTHWNTETLPILYPDLQEHDYHALSALYQNEVYHKACAYPEVYRELPYMMKQDTSIQHGFIDFVAIKDEEVIVIDFKTDHVENMQQLLDLYQSQLLAYADAMHVLYPQKQINAYIYSLSLHTDIKVDVMMKG